MPVNLFSVVRAWFFFAAHAGGFRITDPSVPMRLFFSYPLLAWLPVLLLVRRRLSSGQKLSPLTSLVGLALLVLVGVHTVAAILVRHAAALQTHYLAMLLPSTLMLIAEGVAGLEGRLRGLVWSTLILALVFSNAVSGWRQGGLREVDTLSLEPRLAKALANIDPSRDVLTFRTTAHAKAVNTLYFGDARQSVLRGTSARPWAGALLPQDPCGRVVLVTSLSGAHPGFPPGWQPTGQSDFGKTRVDFLREGSTPQHEDRPK
jgi:hypothetical protein